MPGNTGAREFLTANLVGNCLYGIYIYIVVTCSFVFYEKFKTKKVNYYQFGTFVLLTVLCTTRVVVDNLRTMETWTHPLPDGTVAYPGFGAPSTALLVAIWVVETIIADTYIIYRLWIVWGRRWTILPFPVAALCACIGTGSYFLHVLVAQQDRSAADFFEHINSSSISFTATTLTLNLFCTSVIGWKIYWLRRATSDIRVTIGKDPIQRFVIAILESAAIYTTILLAGLITTAMGSFASYAIFPLLPTVIAVVFGLIIVRPSKGIAVGDRKSHGSSQSTEASSNSDSSGSSEMGGLPNMKASVEVKLDRFISRGLDRSQELGKEEV